MKVKFLHLCTFFLFLFSMNGVGQNNAAAQAGVKLHARVLLQGALINANGPLMRDDLRSNNLLPWVEPYSAMARFTVVGSGGEQVSNSGVFQVTGDNAIVDWVFVELRSADDPKIVLATRSALLQRDGDVVDVDGSSPLHFPSVAAGDYLVAVRHRNHLGVMSVEAIALNKLPKVVDFSDPEFPTYGVNAQAPAGNRVAMWGGNVNQDKLVIARGPNNDSFYIFSNVMLAAGNEHYANNYINAGYHLADVNLDGMAIYSGPNSDYAHLLYKIVLPSTLNCPDVNASCMIREQLP